uniref:Uncharacterized protein n=1 Tax=Craspedostauros australis TaxID=1486917 RepID=A0A7R9WR21_9STRA|mmetsp:Transcript_14858/g.41162  ORF Transcript_14858/g.41162 Transcript_14858/m.41162 type:complete len:146 (+) Transcript_14858:404-841(+)
MTCSTNPELGGDISGPFAGIFATTTELVGADNAVLYQVLLGDSIFQSQLTTLTETPDGAMRRTRTAQSFAGGVPINASFFRERKVDKATFYAEMQAIITAYNIQVSDTCTWVDNFDPANGGPVIDSGLEAGIAGCMAHLETSFEL